MLTVMTAVTTLFREIPTVPFAPHNKNSNWVGQSVAENQLDIHINRSMFILIRARMLGAFFRYWSTQLLGILDPVLLQPTHQKQIHLFSFEGIGIFCQNLINKSQ